MLSAGSCCYNFFTSSIAHTGRLPGLAAASALPEAAGHWLAVAAAAQAQQGGPAGREKDQSNRGKHGEVLT